MKFSGWKTAAGLIGLAVCEVVSKLWPEGQGVVDVLKPWLWGLAGLGAADKLRRGVA